MAKRHIVQEGQCIFSIAKKNDFADPYTIYNNDMNRSLKIIRPKPGVLYPGDGVVIPDKKEKKDPRSTGQRHSFKVGGHQVPLRLRLLQDNLSQKYDKRDQPYAHKKYRLKVAGKTYQGNTNAQGLIEQLIPADAEQGELQIAGCTFALRIGHLHPEEYLSGAQARLNNLGFSASSRVVRKQSDQRLVRALQRFQAAYKLKPTGALDKPTQKKLEEAHGS